MSVSGATFRSADSASNDGLSVAALVGFLLMWSASTSTTADAILVLGGLLLVVGGWLYPARDWNLRSHNAIALSVAVVTVSRFVAPGGLTTLPWVRFSLVVSLLAIFVGWLLVTRLPRVAPRVALVVVVAVLSGISAIIRPPPPVDVYRLHVEAGRLISEGQNPYTDMDVPQDMTQPSRLRLSGYAYPPLTIVGYALPSIVMDPRWAATAWWVFLVVLLSRRAARDDYLFWLLIVVVTAPLVVPLLLLTVTEPFVACLLIVGVENYGRRASARNSVLLGLTMGTKQHVPTGLLGIGRQVGWAKGWLVATGAVLAIGSGFLIGRSGYLRATIQPGLTSEPFPLAASLYGLTGGRIEVPTLMTVALASLVGWLVGRGRVVATVVPVIGSTTVILGFAPIVTWTNWVLVMTLAVYHHIARTGELPPLPAKGDPPQDR